MCCISKITDLGVVANESPFHSERLSSGKRSGFSLLEVIIATAVLAGSAMVLISLIGVGTRYGSKAEQRLLALSAAQTILDEYLIDQAAQEDSDEVSGIIEGLQAMSYRLSVSSLTGDGNAVDAANVSGLIRITVEVFDSPQVSRSESGDVLCRLTRLVRRRPELSPENAGSQEFALGRGRLDD